MLLSHLSEKFGRGAGASGPYILVSAPDTFHGFLKVLMLPSEIGGQGVIEHRGGVLASSTRIFLELCLALRRNGYHFHGSSPVGFPAFIVVDQAFAVNVVASVGSREISSWTNEHFQSLGTRIWSSEIPMKAFL